MLSVICHASSAEIIVDSISSRRNPEARSGPRADLAKIIAASVAWSCPAVGIRVASDGLVVRKDQAFRGDERSGNAANAHGGESKVVERAGGSFEVVLLFGWSAESVKFRTYYE